jgi:hypothetical protein
LYNTESQTTLLAAGGGGGAANTGTAPLAGGPGLIGTSGGNGGGQSVGGVDGNGGSVGYTANDCASSNGGGGFLSSGFGSPIYPPVFPGTPGDPGGLSALLGGTGGHSLGCKGTAGSSVGGFGFGGGGVGNSAGGGGGGFSGGQTCASVRSLFLHLRTMYRSHRLAVTVHVGVSEFFPLTSKELVVMTRPPVQWVALKVLVVGPLQREPINSTCRGRMAELAISPSSD